MKLIDEKTLKNDFRDYRVIPFWSWNNRLDKDELLRQIEGMKRSGIGGFIMHARTGLKTEYLSEEWFDCVRVCLDKAKELDMNAWMYDENGWPSGFCGGKLLEDEENLALYLERTTGDFDPAARAVFVKEGDDFRRVKAPCGAAEYHNVYVKASPTNTDILNPAVVRKFIESTYDRYERYFGDRFGKEFVGFFTDEPQYYRWGTPYTKMADGYFRDLYGEDVADGFIWLFEHNERGYVFRDRYFRLLNRLYTENFYKVVYEWCDARGLLLTGHSVEESALYLQMWGGAAVMPSYEYEHLPGIDFLGAAALRGEPFDSPLAFRQIGSAAEQCGKKQVLTETFGCSGWDRDPRELKYLAELQYVGGANFMCTHLMSYSLQSMGKLDYPPSFSHHENWWGEEYKTFCDYFAHLGYLLANTRERVNTLIIHPQHNIYRDYVRADSDYEKEDELAFHALLKRMETDRVSYHFADEWMLSRMGKTEGSRLRVGACAYDYVVLSSFRGIDASTKKLLEEYAAAGGKIYADGALPDLVDGAPGSLDVQPNLTWAEIVRGQPVALSADGRIRYTYRTGEGYELLYVLNLDKKDTALVLPEGFDALNAETFARTRCAGKATVRPQTSALFVRGGEKAADPEKADTREIAEVSSLLKMTECSPNNLTLDTFARAEEGGEFGEPKYCYLHKDELIRADYKGNLRAKYTFEMAEDMPLTLTFEAGKWLSITCNGKEIAPRQSAFDVLFCEADLAGLTRKGTNELIFEIYYYQSPIVRYALYDPLATESVRNCLVFDTEVESVYLSGDFVLDENRVIRPRGKEIAPARIDAQGYAMFSGDMLFEGDVNLPGGRAEIGLEGRFMTAAVYVDGEEQGRAVLSDRVAIEASAGTHRLGVRVKSSLRNKFGPHHAVPEPDGVSPLTFHLLGRWKDGKSKYFDEGYHSVPFGLDRVTVRK